MDSFHQLIHVSDLHFGDDLFKPSWAASLLAYTPVGGVAVHNYDVAAALTDAVRVHRLGTVPISVIATGDLTTWGRAQAFSTALTFLRGKVFVGLRKFVGLNDAGTPVVPGNHDIWGGMPLGMSFATPNPASTRADFDAFFNPPAQNLFSGSYHPYCVRLCDGPPAIYLYGLDSTRVDLSPWPRWNIAAANGMVDPSQLDDLRQLLPSELDEPRVRIAAIHHPLAYRQTVNSSGRLEVLLNLDEVLDTLQNLRFAAVMCGHQHLGFARDNAVANSSNPPLLVLSAGTSTQMVRLLKQEKELLKYDVNTVPPHLRRMWAATVDKCNEYRLYDFKTEDRRPDSLQIFINKYSYNPHLSAFAEQKPPRPLSKDLGPFVIT